MWQVIKDIIEKLQSWWGGFFHHHHHHHYHHHRHHQYHQYHQYHHYHHYHHHHHLFVQQRSSRKKFYLSIPVIKLIRSRKKVLEILFSLFNLSAKEGDNYVAYFPSRLLSYIKQKDAFFAFRQFLNDIGTTPDEVFKNREIANFCQRGNFGAL